MKKTKGVDPVKPITDPNNPRYQEYQDSLVVHNAVAEYNQMISQNAALGQRTAAANLQTPLRAQASEIITKRGWDVPDNPSAAYYFPGQGTDVEGFFPKPVPPVGVIASAAKPLPSRPQVSIVPAPALSINQLANERPLPEIKVKNGMWEDGRLTQDWTGVPGLKVVSAKSVKTGKLEPIGIQNAAGQMIDWDKYKDAPLPKGFQYPQGGAQPPAKKELGGPVNTTSMDPQAFLALPPDQQAAYLQTLSEEDRAMFVEHIQSIQDAKTIASGQTAAPAASQLTAPPASQLTAPPAASRIDNLTQIASIQPTPVSGAQPARRDTLIGRLNAIEPNSNERKPLGDVLRVAGGELSDKLGTVANVATSFLDMSNISDPGNAEIGPTALMHGAAGLLSGGPIGGLIGAITGALSAGNQRQAFEEQDALRQNRAIKGLRMAPTHQDTGGVVQTDADIEIPVQEEEGEVMLLPNGKLVDSMATQTHKQMKGKEKDKVTDVIPSGTMIFSNSKKRIINLAKIKDDILTITRGHYSEDGNVPGETITMGDVYGKKGKVTPADLARKVRGMHPIVEKPMEQIEVATNGENMRRRAELLLPIMRMQEGIYKKFEYDKPVKYKTGGTVTAPSADDDSLFDLSVISKAETSGRNKKVVVHIDKGNNTINIGAYSFNGGNGTAYLKYLESLSLSPSAQAIIKELKGIPLSGPDVEANVKKVKDAYARLENELGTDATVKLENNFAINSFGKPILNYLRSKPGFENVKLTKGEATLLMDTSIQWSPKQWKKWIDGYAAEGHKTKSISEYITDGRVAQAPINAAKGIYGPDPNKAAAVADSVATRAKEQLRVTKAMDDPNAEKTTTTPSVATPPPPAATTPADTLGTATPTNPTKGPLATGYVPLDNNAQKTTPRAQKPIVTQPAPVVTPPTPVIDTPSAPPTPTELAQAPDIAALAKLDQRDLDKYVEPFDRATTDRILQQVTDYNKRTQDGAIPDPGVASAPPPIPISPVIGTPRTAVPPVGQTPSVPSATNTSQDTRDYTSVGRPGIRPPTQNTTTTPTDPQTPVAAAPPLGTRPISPVIGGPRPTPTVPTQIPDIATLAKLDQRALDKYVEPLDRATTDKILADVTEYNKRTQDGYVPIHQGVVDPLPLAKVSPLGTPTDQGATDPAAPQGSKRPRVSDSTFAAGDKIIADQIPQIQSDYKTSAAAAQDLYRSQRFRNVAILASKLSGLGMQNPEVTPVIQGTEHIDSMFPKVTESQINAQVDPVRQSQSRTLQAINDSGVNGGSIGSAIASTQANLINNESQVRNRALTVNQSQDAKRLERLKSIIDTNNANTVGAENATRGNRNELISNVSGAVSDSINAGGGLKEALNNRMDELKKWRQQSTATVTDSQYKNIVTKEQARIEREHYAKMEDYLRQILQNTIKTG